MDQPTEDENSAYVGRHRVVEGETESVPKIDDRLRAMLDDRSAGES